MSVSIQGSFSKKLEDEYVIHCRVEVVTNLLSLLYFLWSISASVIAFFVNRMLGTTFSKQREVFWPTIAIAAYVSAQKCFNCKKDSLMDVCLQKMMLCIMQRLLLWTTFIIPLVILKADSLSVLCDVDDAKVCAVEMETFSVVLCRASSHLSCAVCSRSVRILLHPALQCSASDVELLLKWPLMHQSPLDMTASFRTIRFYIWSGVVCMRTSAVMLMQYIAMLLHHRKPSQQRQPLLTKEELAVVGASSHFNIKSHLSVECAAVSWPQRFLFAQVSALVSDQERG